MNTGSIVANSVAAAWSPAPTESLNTYQAQAGDTLATIAQKFGVSTEALHAANPGIGNPDVVYAGQIIEFPAAATSTRENTSVDSGWWNNSGVVGAGNGEPDIGSGPTRADVDKQPAPVPSPSDVQRPPFDVDEPKIDLATAARTLLDHYDQVVGTSPLERIFGPQGKISKLDLLAVANSKDPSITPALRNAAKFLLKSPVGKHALDVGAGKGEVDGIISRDDLKGVIKTLATPGEPVRVLDTAAGKGGRDGHTSDADIKAALKDPGVPASLRAVLVGLSDDALLDIVGRPRIDPSLSKADQQLLLRKFAGLARLSPLGATEAEQLAAYKTTITIGGKGGGNTSHNVITLARDTLTASPSAGIGVLAHEGGHAIFGKSGLQSKVDALEKRGVLPHGVASIINEAFAGAYGNRAHLAVEGLNYGDHGDLAASAHLSILQDVLDNIKNDDTFYAKNYNVNTADARAHLAEIKAVLKDLLVPYLQANTPISDPQLTQGL